jgi:hypothetical protein
MGMGATDPLVVEFQCLSLADTATQLTKGLPSPITRFSHTGHAIFYNVLIQGILAFLFKTIPGAPAGAGYGLVLSDDLYS